MKDYCCPKCGSIDVFIDDRGNQKALMCGDCGAWIKWIGKKEMPLIKRYIDLKDANFNKPLWQVIKEIEENKGTRKAYLHHEYQTGDLQLNIEFNNDIADKTLTKSNIDISNYNAYWE